MMHPDELAKLADTYNERLAGGQVMTCREAAEAAGYASPSTGQRLLDTLEAAGLIPSRRREPNKSHGKVGKKNG